ncbi:transposase [Streptomyces niveus]|uniref:Transposase n=1 Tax=Streptomyces niveus TaxID=193462 RepID=A0ABZ1ZZ57_STRNV
MGLPHHEARPELLAESSRFRGALFECLTARGDELFELTDALLCADGPVTSPVELTLVAEHRRGHGAMYEALNSGNVDVPRLRQVLAGLPMPRAADGRLVLAVDVSNWLRPDAPTSADRLFCHVYGRSGRSSDQFIPGWPYSFVAALESGRTSWCQLLDAVRLGPEDDVAEVTATQLRRVITDLIEMGRWHFGDRDILVVFDAGYDAPRMAHLLDGLPVEVLGRMRSDRVMRRPSPSLKEYALAYPQGGRPPKHGKEFRFAKPETWGEPDAATTQVTDRYGTAHAMAWDRIHPRLTTRSAWIDHTGELPIIEGTLIRLQVDRLPGGGDPLPLWLRTQCPGPSSADGSSVEGSGFLSGGAPPTLGVGSGPRILIGRCRTADLLSVRAGHDVQVFPGLGFRVGHPAEVLVGACSALAAYAHERDGFQEVAVRTAVSVARQVHQQVVSVRAVHGRHQHTAGA